MVKIKVARIVGSIVACESVQIQVCIYSQVNSKGGLQLIIYDQSVSTGAFHSLGRANYFAF